MNQLSGSQLGRASAYVDHYDASLLYPIARQPKRAELGLVGVLPFLGADVWTAFELSWLGPRGKPQVALAHITVPCESTHIIESKSLKLYLNSFNNTVFADAAAVLAHLRADLNEAAWRGAVVQSSVGVRLLDPELFDREPVQELDGLSLDRLDVECRQYTPAPELLRAAADEPPVTEVLTSRQVSYSGAAINQEGLLQYLVSFRNHHEFHEQCVERIFMDIWQRCRPIKLAVYARYTRRGGLDINPFRTSYAQSLPANVRTARQ